MSPEDALLFARVLGGDLDVHGPTIERHQRARNRRGRRPRPLALPGPGRLRGRLRSARELRSPPRQLPKRAALDRPPPGPERGEEGTPTPAGRAPRSAQGPRSASPAASALRGPPRWIRRRRRLRSSTAAAPTSSWRCWPGRAHSAGPPRCARIGWRRSRSPPHRWLRPSTRGDRILVDGSALRPGPLRRGDVVLFSNPDQPQPLHVRRVVALPRDAIGLCGVALAGSERPPPAPNTAGLIVPPGHSFVLGDRREVTVDSRECGSVPLVNLLGRVPLVRYPRPARLPPGPARRLSPVASRRPGAPPPFSPVVRPLTEPPTPRSEAGLPWRQGEPPRSAARGSRPSLPR